MRFLCRIGWHKWGKWSCYWYRNSTVDDTAVTRQVRSLKCLNCDHIKDATITILKRNEDLKPYFPEWKDQ